MAAEIPRLALGGGGGGAGGERLPAAGEDSAAAATNAGKRPVVGLGFGSSLAAMAAAAAAAGIQPDAFALGGPAEYPAGDGERDVLMVSFLRSIAAFLADGTCQMQALALRFILPCDGVCRSLHLTRAPPPPAVSAARQGFRAMCPFVRLAAAAANLSIAEVMEAERAVVHVVDLGGGVDANQWVELVRLVAARPGGPPGLLRLTVVNESEDFLSAAAAYVAAEAQRLDLSLQFHPVLSSIEELSATATGSIGSRLVVIPGQPLAVVANLQIHRLLAFPDYVDGVASRRPAAEQSGSSQHTMTTATKTKADALLRAIRDLNPKLVVLTENEADHNVAELGARVWNALNYYAALFDALEASSTPPAAVPPHERACVERWVLGEEIKDIVVREGTGRRERHETLGRWAERMVAAGFSPVTAARALASTETLAQQMVAAGGGGAVAGVLRAAHGGGCFPVICWCDVPVFSVSTWTARRVLVPAPPLWPPAAAGGAGPSGSGYGGDGPSTASSSAAMWWVG
ncbi:GRAS family protein TF80-like [Oryza glaberrima]|uniref:GRAS family protein TF80-like n=1 Tax=Oryza glaberrima TaxID=4538 RepID=UPI00224C2F87|nr:GRAS family protein TF80-like [Oryza glaberrima]